MAAYLTSLSSLLAVSILAAAGLNITLGYGGVFSGGHAVFYGMGAYTVIYMAGSLHGQVLLVVPVLRDLSYREIVGLLCPIGSRRRSSAPGNLRPAWPKRIC